MNKLPTANCQLSTELRRKPELLAPAGDWEGLASALAGGCDSVYFGVKGITMRAAAGNFDLLELPKLMDKLHSSGIKGYLALNVIVYDSELDKIDKILSAAKNAGVDGVIAWDQAVLSSAKKHNIDLHLSTQASVSNFEAFKFYACQGIKRIVLARECSLEDIARIKSKAVEEDIDSRIEVFIHGAMCVSVSGRCFLSEYTFDKSANRGECVQPCRREYKIMDVDDEAEYVLANDHVLSPKDLCTIDFIDQIIETGADVFKIEGRMRSSEYVRVAVECYRKAIDAYFDGALDENLKKELKSELEKVYNRGFSDGFYTGHQQDWRTRKLEHTYDKLMIGRVTRYFDKIGVAEIKVVSWGIQPEDKLLFMGKKTPAEWVDDYQMQIEGQDVTSVEKGTSVGIKLPFAVRPRDKVFIWRNKCLNK